MKSKSNETIYFKHNGIMYKMNEPADGWNNNRPGSKTLKPTIIKRVKKTTKKTTKKPIKRTIKRATKRCCNRKK